MRLVQERDAGSGRGPLGEDVVADDVAGQAGGSAEPDRHALLALVQHRGPIGRLDDVRHVASGRDVGDRDGHRIVEGIEDFADQYARVECDRLAGFEIDLDPVALADLA